MKDVTLHMIGNAHIDPVWLWQWQEGFQEVLATFRSALDRMKEDPDFRFTASSAAFYTWAERIDPEMFAEIQERVAEGRWELVGGWWIEPDCNIPGGESFVRQTLYGQRYFKRKFGMTTHVGYNIDSFGHNAMLPQILKKSGLDTYTFLRPGPHEKGLPGRLFWWESDDGSRVLAFRIPFEYLSWGKDLEMHARRCARQAKPPMDEFTCFYGVGNHGGGPTRENLESIRRLQDDPEMPRVIFSTLSAFFQAALDKDWPLPVVHDELQHHASGTYSAHSGIKFWNRQAEHALMRAEKWSAIAGWVTGLSYPAAELERAWHDVLFNQFHDILAGTSLEEAYDDARNLYGEAFTIADRALNDALQSMAWHMAIPHEEGVKPIVVFNPHPWRIQAGIEVEVGWIPDTTALTDDAGEPVAFQRVQSHATAGRRARIAFIADLPPLGYRVYRLVSEGNTTESESLIATETQIENDRFRLTFDPETGYLVNLYDKQADVEVLAGPAARPVVINDPSDTWSHNVYRFADEAGAFKATRMQVIEQGPVKAVLQIESTYGDSRLVQDFTLYHDLDRIDVHVTVDWHEQFRMLKLRFPVNLNFITATHAIPYGRIERFANGEEDPIQQWVDLSGVARGTNTPYGLSVLNNGKSSVDVYLNDIGLTVLRSPIYAHHIPTVPDPEQSHSFIDQGRQQFAYSLLPHRFSWEDAHTVHRAAELNEPAVALIATGRPEETLPLVDSYLEVEPDRVVVTVLKHAEDGEALIIRAYETTGAATHATLRLPAWDRVIEANFGPAEIKTFRVPRDPAEPVIETNLLEETSEDDGSA